MIVKITNKQELKTRKGINNATVILLGIDQLGDGKGGIFYWDENSILTEDGHNVFQVNNVNVGRWRRATSGITGAEEVTEIINILNSNNNFINSIINNVITNTTVNDSILESILNALNVEVKDVNDKTLFFAFAPEELLEQIPDTPTFTVTFVTNGGSEIEPLEVKENYSIVKPNDPIKENYNLEGWYSDSGLTVLWDFENDKVIEDITLYANWNAGAPICELPTEIEIIGNTSPTKGETEDYSSTITGGNNYDIKWTTYGGTINGSDSGTSVNITWRDLRSTRNYYVKLTASCGEQTISDVKTFIPKTAATTEITNLTASGQC